LQPGVPRHNHDVAGVGKQLSTGEVHRIRAAEDEAVRELRG
jgi:hypothetical protein